MTVIVNTIWGGKVTQIVDRQITIERVRNNYEVYDSESNKLCVILARNALVSIAYTGIAVAHQRWIDCIIAECLAHRELENSMIQPGAAYLNRPIHTIVKELSWNLNGRLNSDNRSRVENLRISIIGFHLTGSYTPLAWELSRGNKEKNGNRYFQITKHKVGKFLRENPAGLWGDTLGNPGKTIDEGMQKLSNIVGLDHDGVERYVSDLIKKRSTETSTVSKCCISVQLDPFNNDGQVQVTFYPTTISPFLSPWVMTPRLICSPALATSSMAKESECSNYVIGGFEDVNTNLNVLTRIPSEYKETYKNRILLSTKVRKNTC